MATFFNRRGRPPHPDILTPAEWRVLELVRAGKTNSEIAYDLAISIPGVKYHITNMLGKLQLQDRASLAAWQPEQEQRRSDRTRWALTPIFPWAVKSVAVASVGAAAVGATGIGLWVSSGGGEPAAAPEAQQPTVSPAPTVRDITHLAPRFVDTGHGWRYSIGRVTETDGWVTIIYQIQGDYEGLRAAQWPPGARNQDGIPTLFFSIHGAEASIQIPEDAQSVTVALSPAIRDTPAGPVLEDGDSVLTIPLH